MTYGFPDLSAQMFVSPLKATGINGTAIGNTLLGQWSMSVVPVLLIYKLDSSSGVVTPPFVSVGTDSPNYVNISASGVFPSGGLLAQRPIIAANTPIYCRVGVGAVGLGATHTFSVWLFGVHP